MKSGRLFMNNVKLCKDENCLYLIQDLQFLETYDKAQAIVDFCDKESKNFEKEIDKVIIGIFEKNGINIPNTTKSVLKRAFDTLNKKGKDIKVIDLYSNNENKYHAEIYQCEIIKQTPLFTICLELDRFLQMGVEIKEIDLWN